MLLMIVTVNLAQDALAMSRNKVIVKRLNAIQNFEAINVLCEDKTGTVLNLVDKNREDVVLSPK